MTNGCTLAAHAFIANNLTGDKGDWGFILINLEEWRLEMSLRQTFNLAGTPTELGIMLPVRAFWGGLLDLPLDGYHAILGIPGNPPDERYQVKLIAFVNGQIFSMYDPAIGFADPMLWASAKIAQNFSATFQLRLPLGDATKLLGAGATIMGGTLSYTEKNWGAQFMLSFPYTNQSAMAGIAVQPSWGLRAWHKPGWLPAPWSRLSLELNLQSSPLVVPGTWGAWQIGLVVRLDDFGFTEDLTRGLPDVVFDQAFSIGCPW